VDRTAHRIAHPVRSHLDHQNDPVALLSRCPASAAAGRRKPGQAGPEPAIPRLARGPGQPSGGTADSHHATSRAATGRPRAASRGQGRPSRNQSAPCRAWGRRRPSARRPAEKHPRRDSQTQSGWAPTGRAIDGPRLRACRGGGRLAHDSRHRAWRGFLIPGRAVRFVPQWPGPAGTSRGS
jgi:hypothetical protein